MDNIIRWRNINILSPHNDFAVSVCLFFLEGIHPLARLSRRGLISPNVSVAVGFRSRACDPCLGYFPMRTLVASVPLILRPNRPCRDPGTVSDDTQIVFNRQLADIRALLTQIVFIRSMAEIRAFLHGLLGTSALRAPVPIPLPQSAAGVVPPQVGPRRFRRLLRQICRTASALRTRRTSLDG